MPVAIIKFSDLSYIDRWDAEYWIKLTKMLHARGVKPADVTKVREVIQELEDRKEFPHGTRTGKAKPPAHVECPKCMSWQVDSTVVTTVKRSGGEKHTEEHAVYDCQACKQHWETNSGTNSEAA